MSDVWSSLSTWISAFAAAGIIAISTCATAEESPAPLSVYQVDPLRDGLIIGSTVLAGALPYAFTDHLIYIPSSVSPDQVNPLDRHVIGNNTAWAGTLSDVTVGLVLAAPVALDLLSVGATQEYFEDMMVYAETMSINGALTTLFKFTVQRPAPMVYTGLDPGLNTSASGYQSFYSGHTSFAFSALAATSVTLNLRHGPSLWPWLATAVVGTSVAAERVAAGQHFYTDVGVGAIMGMAVGVLVPWLHKREMETGTRIGLKSIGDGAALMWTKRF